MRLELKELELDKELKAGIEIAKMINNSLSNLSSVALKEKTGKESLDWKASLLFETNDKEELILHLDTKKEILSYLDGEGDLVGEKLYISDEEQLLVAGKGSSIYELLIFLELKKLNILDEEQVRALELTMFPNWASGYLVDNLEENKVLKDLREIFGPILEELEILKKVDIDAQYKNTFEGDKLLGTIVTESIVNYIKTELEFIYYDSEYGFDLSKKELNQLNIGAIKFQPNMEEVELYS